MFPGGRPLAGVGTMPGRSDSRLTLLAKHEQAMAPHGAELARYADRARSDREHQLNGHEAGRTLEAVELLRMSS